MNDKFILKNQNYIIFGLALIGLILIILLYLIFEYEKKIERDMFKISTQDVLSITRNKAKNIETLLKSSDNYIEDIKRNKLLRYKIEQSIDDLITDNIKYSYLLYKDKEEVFRFLVDSSNIEEKAFLNQKFDVESSKWFDLYEKKKPIIIRHDILQKLSLTYLVPILQKNKVKLVLVIDFSIKKAESIYKIIDLLKKSIFLIIFIICIFFIILIFQITKYRSVKKSSIVDKLTGVYNRNYLYEIESDINLTEYIIVALDIDYFKKINDTYGHDIGDFILEEVGKNILNAMREKDDIAIRYGGEEFVLLVKNTKHAVQQALNVSYRVFNNIREHKMYIDEKEFINITVSMGINTKPHMSKNFSSAFKLADIALYKAKNTGRDKVVIYKENE